MIIVGGELNGFFCALNGLIGVFLWLEELLRASYGGGIVVFELEFGVGVFALVCFEGLFGLLSEGVGPDVAFD